MSVKVSRRWAWVMLAALAVSSTARADVAVSDGAKVAFLGDSITAYGATSPSGYVRLVESGLKANGIKIGVFPAGISGNKSNQMLDRIDRDVISKKPDWVTVSCGVNDVWHGEKGVPLDQYKTNMTSLVDKCQAAGIKVMILTATPIMEQLDNDLNKKLAPYNEFLHQLATEKKLALADLNADIVAGLKEAQNKPHPPGTLLTRDGVHMNPLGDRVMATSILKAFGLDDAQMQKAQTAWLDAPKSVELLGKGGPAVSLRQYERLYDLAAKQNKTVVDLVNDSVVKAIDGLLGEPTAAAEAPKP